MLLSRIAALLGSAVFAIVVVGPHTTRAQSKPATPRAQATGTAHVETFSTGLKLSLSLPEQHYPANAIVQATMRVKNVTTHAIGLGTTSFYGCGGTFAPQAVVMSHRIQVFPPVVVGTTGPECGAPRPNQPILKLSAGATLTGREYLLLRGPQIRALVTVHDMRAHSELKIPSLLVGTPILTVTLTRSDAPPVTVQRGNIPVVHIVRPSYARGKLFIGSGWSRLAQHGTVGKHGFVGIMSFGSGWTRQTRLTIRPTLIAGYTRFVEWHIVAGWLGHSTVNVDFRQP